MSSLTDFTVQSNWVCVGLLFTRIWVFVCLQKFTKRELQITIKVLTLILTRDRSKCQFQNLMKKNY